VIVLDETYIISITGQCLHLILLLSAPMLLAALTVGLSISIFQATTSIQEQTLSFVPKIVAAFAAIMIFGPWIANMISAFAIQIFTSIPSLGNR
jgi:flagellar biosynthesis protein FliQ